MVSHHTQIKYKLFIPDYKVLHMLASAFLSDLTPLCAFPAKLQAHWLSLRDEHSGSALPRVLHTLFSAWDVLPPEFFIVASPFYSGLR